MISDWKHVLATHEEAQTLVKDRPWPGDDYLGVALPSAKADNRRVQLRYNGREAIATVRDLGPFCHDDDEYVDGNQLPRAQIYKGRACPVRKGDDVTRPTVPDGKGGWRTIEASNGAGIDLFPGTAKALGIAIGDNVWVYWRFVVPALPV